MKTNSNEPAFLQYHHERGPNEAKTRELILHISRHRFGLTRLNKALWKADFDAYRVTGQSITGEEYQHIQYGPGLRRMRPLLGKMQQAGELQFEAAQEFQEQNPVPQREANLRRVGLSEQEIQIVDGAIALLEGMTASEARDWSHDFAGWKLTDYGEPIPYEWIYWSERPLTGAEIEYGLSLDRAL
ncbi:MAG: Panacea domain-containing protein [Candidatus Dormibacteria bacterium]